MVANVAVLVNTIPYTTRVTVKQKRIVLVNTIPYTTRVTVTRKRMGDIQEEHELKQAVDVPVKLAFIKLTQVDVAVKPSENT